MIALRVLITNAWLRGRSGTKLYVRDPSYRTPIARLRSKSLSRRHIGRVQLRLPVVGEMS